MSEPVKMPARSWGTEEPEPEHPPLVLVASTAGRGDPEEVPARGASWRPVARAARAAGWEVAITYALAWRRDRHYLNGNLAKAAHHVHTVAVRVARGDARGAAIWAHESALPDVPTAGWSYVTGMFRGELKHVAAREFKARLA